MRRALLLTAVTGLAVCCAVRAYDTPTKKNAPVTANNSGMKQAYLGIDVAPMPTALWSQMPGIIPKGEGIVVGFVTKNSPADKAGWKPDDVLLQFNNQKIYSPEQLIKLVRATKPGTEIAVSLVRGGKAVASKIKVGEHQALATSEEPFGFRLVPDDKLMGMFDNTMRQMKQNDESAWESFDAIQLSRVDANHWKAEVKFRNKDGKITDKKFQGTRDDIRKDVKAEKSLPANEREQLLRVFDVDEPVFEFHFPWFDQKGPGRPADHPKTSSKKS
ncbi:MAG TPA: PDZ domain-containing protein [Fimbriiglobus sp.]|jgi:hypothetical protein